MKKLSTLVKMQLKEKLNFKRLELKDISLFHIAVSTLAKLLKFAMVTAVVAVLLFFVNRLGVFSLVSTTPTSVMSILFGILLLLSIISCTSGLTKAMYFSRDNTILLVLPNTPLEVYLSKLIIFFVFELKRTFGFMFPVFVGYFIIHNYPLLSYLWLAVCFVFVSLFAVLFGSILSVPAMWISNFFRQNRALQIGTLLATIAVSALALFLAISLIPEHLDLRSSWPNITMSIRHKLTGYTENFRFFYNLTKLFLGETYDVIKVAFPFGKTLVRFLILFGFNLLFFGLGLLIVLPLFYKMASTPFEYLKKQTKPKKNKSTHKNLATFRTEMIISVKDPTRLFSNVAIMISIPLLIFLLNKIFFAMNTSSMGNYLVTTFNVVIIMFIALNANTFASSIYSRDGRSAYLIKTQPTKAAILLFSKLIPNALFTVVSLLMTFVIILISAKIGTLNSIFLMLGIFGVYFAHLIYCAQLDIMNPQYEIYATVGSSDANPNETKATVSAFVISLICSAAVMLLQLDKSSRMNEISFSDTLTLETLYLKFAVLGLVLAVYMTLRYFLKIKLYYKEK